MEFRRFKHIIAIKTGEGPESRLTGFHSHNMQVAELTPELWTAMTEPAPGEELQELEAWNQEFDPKARDIDVPQAPKQLLVNVAQICNLKCDYCAAGADGSFGEAMKHVDLETIYEQVRSVLHDIPSGGEFTLTYFGGEPLVAPENIRGLARFVRLQTAGRGIRVQHRVITNGTLLSPANAELLAEIGCHVTISLDGPPEINDRFRKTKGGQGSTAATLRGLGFLQNVRSRLGSLSASAVFGRHYTDVVSTYRFFREFGFDAYRFEFAVEEGDAEASREFALSLNRAAELAYEIGGEAELRRITYFDGAFRTLDQQNRIFNHCGAGKSLLTVDGKGRVAACQWFLGRPEEELGRGADLNHEKVAAYAGRLVDLNGCQTCWARHLCGGGCMYANSVKTGEKHKKDHEFCNRARTTLGKAIEFYAQSRKESEKGDRYETH